MSILYTDLPQTNFPNNNDVFATNADISASDATLIKQFQDAVQTKNFPLAQSILVQIPNYTQKIVTASKLNKFNECITALERFYGTDIQSYITTKQAEWQGIINEFTYLNTYSSTAQYAINNYVTYTASGATNLYICLAVPPVGTPPTNVNYWRVLTIRGLTGASGTGMEFMGVWDGAQSYRVLDCVNYQNSLWGCITPNTNQVPYEGSAYWQLVYNGNPVIIPLSTAQPQNPENGSLWFQII